MIFTRVRRASRVRAAVAALVVMASIAATASPASAATSAYVLGCSLSIENPHVSAGTSGSVVVKTRVTCGPGISYVQVELLLYKCAGNQTTQVEVFCDLVSENGDIIFNPTSGTQYTRQVAKNSAPDGYYVGVTNFAVCALGSRGEWVPGVIQSNTAYVDTTTGPSGKGLPSVRGIG